jgi:GH35 family endo-1,4-beta-xylanase
MAHKKKLTAEAFVRKILTQTFKQKADSETVRAVAEKVSQVVAESASKKEPVQPKKRAA